MDNKAYSLLLKNIQNLEYKSRIRIFINFKMQYYYSKHECSLRFVKWYSIPLLLMCRLCPAFFK